MGWRFALETLDAPPRCVGVHRPLMRPVGVSVCLCRLYKAWTITWTRRGREGCGGGGGGEGCSGEGGGGEGCGGEAAAEKAAARRRRRRRPAEKAAEAATGCNVSATASRPGRRRPSVHHRRRWRAAVDAQPLAGVRVRDIPNCGLDHCIALGRRARSSRGRQAEMGTAGTVGLGQADGSSELYTPRRVGFQQRPPPLPRSVPLGSDRRQAAVAIRFTGGFSWGRTSRGHAARRAAGACARRRAQAPRRRRGGCGEDHTLALDDKGQVWAWGRGEHGQLFGAAGKQFTAPPQRSSRLTGREGAVAVAAAGHCSCSRLVGTSPVPRCTGKCSERARQLLLCQMGLGLGADDAQLFGRRDAERAARPPPIEAAPEYRHDDLARDGHQREQ